MVQYILRFLAFCLDLGLGKMFRLFNSDFMSSQPNSDAAVT